MEETHIAFMHRALELARRAKGRTSPNPLVGAVIVKNGTVVGEGTHQRAGTPHAEIHAVTAAGEDAKGAVLYTNLEPCCHWGRTPPCTEALIHAGIAHVYVAEIDRNPQVAGKGIAQLENAGIPVHVGICAEEAAQLNEVHTKYIQTGQPFVILKIAMSLDGKIATVSGDSQWITSEASRQKGHEIRDAVDAILVGSGTVARDNPALTTRLHKRKGQDATRVVLDSRGRTRMDARIFNAESSAGVIFAVTPAAPPENVKALEKAGAEVITVPTVEGEGLRQQGKVCFKTLMPLLGKRQITSVLIEGGGEVNASAVASGVVDKVMCFVAPKLIGGRNAPGPLGGEGIRSLVDVPELRNITVTPIRTAEAQGACATIENCDVLIEGYL